MEVDQPDVYLLRPISEFGSSGDAGDRGSRSGEDPAAYGSIDNGEKKHPTRENVEVVPPVAIAEEDKVETGVYPMHDGVSLKSSFDEDPSEPEVVSNNHLSFGAKIFRTIALNMAYIAVTLNLGILGPSLIDLGILSGATTSQLSALFTARGVLAIVGSLVLGPIFDKINRYLILGVALFMDFLFIAAVPLCRSLAALLITLSPPEFFNGAIGMGTHLVCIDIWGDNSGPGLQLLNLISVVGFTAAPLLVKPFLAPDRDVLLETNSTSSAALPAPTFEVIEINPLADDTLQWTPKDGFYHHVTSGPGLYRNYGNGSENAPSSSETHVQYAYLMVSLYALVVSIVFLVILCMDKCQLVLSTTDDEDTSDPKLKNTKTFTFKVSMLFFVFNVFYAGIEIGYAGLLMTFAVKYLGWDKNAGANVTALLQASNALVTLLAVAFSRFVRPTIILAVDMVVVMVSLVVLALTVTKFPMILWACSAALGAGYATIMPSTFTWANSFMEVTGKFSSYYWCGFFCGFMALPALTGYLFHDVHMMWFVYMMVINSIGMALVYVMLYILVLRRNKIFQEANKKDNAVML